MDAEPLFAKKLLLSLVLILLPTYIFAFFFERDQETEQRVIANLTTQYPLAKTNTQLDQLLAREFKELILKKSKSPEIIADVFNANKNADILDQLNPISTSLFKRALANAKQIKRKDLELWVTVQYGFYLYTYRKFEVSLPLFMAAIKYLDETASEEVIQVGETYKKSAYFLMTTGDHKKANEYLLIAKKYAEPNDKELASITDNLGLNSIQQNDLVKAETYFKETLMIAKATKDTLRYAKALGNIAELKFKQQKHDTAVVLLTQDIAISKKLKNTQNTIYALVLLGKVYLAKGDLKAANERLQLAKNYAKTKSHLKSAAYEINSLILEIAKQTGDNEAELTARRNLEELKDALIHLDGQETIMKVGWQMEKQKLELSIQKEKAKREKETLIKMFTLAGCLLLVLLTAVVIRYYQQQIKNKKADYDKKILGIMLDKVNSEQKLNTNHQTLAAYKTYLAEKNSQIKNLEFEISKIKKPLPVYLATKMRELLDSHLMDNHSWQGFKRLFTETYPNYQEYLTLNFPELTDSHLRIIFLSKLEMNNTEIARILGLTIDGVKKAKQRLRKKYGDQYDLLFSESIVGEHVN